MQAIVQSRYGPPREVLRLQEIDKPVPADDEVLVRVCATSVHPDVWHVVAGLPYAARLMGPGVRKPKSPVPGTDLAGVIDATGQQVEEFKPGDEVFGESHRGIHWTNGGTYADYAAVPADVLALKPQNVSFEEAASVPTSGIIALNNLQGGGGIKPGQHVLVNGAGGNVGSIALQISKAEGAHVTAVDNARKLDMLRKLGADDVIDYEQTDCTRDGAQYDLIFDVASNLSLSDAKRVLKPTGTYVRIGHEHYGAVGGRLVGGLPGFFRLVARMPFDRQLPAMNFSFPSKKERMEKLKGYLESGALTPIIDRAYPLSRAAEAIEYLTSEQACGRIVLTP